MPQLLCNLYKFCIQYEQRGLHHGHTDQKTNLGCPYYYSRSLRLDFQLQMGIILHCQSISLVSTVGVVDLSNERRALRDPSVPVQEVIHVHRFLAPFMDVICRFKDTSLM